MFLAGLLLKVLLRRISFLFLGKELYIFIYWFFDMHKILILLTEGLKGLVLNIHGKKTCPELNTVEINKQRPSIFQGKIGIPEYIQYSF